MKRFNLFLILAGLTLTSYAQLTLNSADFPVANRYYRMSNGQAFAGMTPSATGPNHTWDYSQLNYTNQQVDSFIDESATNPIFSIVFIDNAFNTNRANHAGRASNFSLGTAITVNDVFNFYYNSSSSYKQVGFGATVNGIPLPITFSPHDFLYRFPMNYANVDSGNSGYTIDLTSTLGIYFSVRRTRIDTVDGWGSLTTPYGTFDVLRQKTVVREQDSIYIDSLGIGFLTPVITTTEYKWLGAGQGVPLLQINTGTGGIVTQILYRDSVRSSVGIPEQELFSDFRMYPVPANDYVLLDFNSSSKGQFEIELVDMTGRVLLTTSLFSLSQGRNIQRLDLTGISPAVGNYIMNLKSEEGKFSRIISLQH